MEGTAIPYTIYLQTPWPHLPHLHSTSVSSQSVPSSPLVTPLCLAKWRRLTSRPFQTTTKACYSCRPSPSSLASTACSLASTTRRSRRPTSTRSLSPSGGSPGISKLRMGASASLCAMWSTHLSSCILSAKRSPGATRAPVPSTLLSAKRRLEKMARFSTITPFSTRPSRRTGHATSAAR